MTLDFVISDKLKKTLKKLGKKNKILAIAVRKKMHQIISFNLVNIKHFKNLRYDSSEYQRVHICNSFVLAFKIKNKVVYFEDLQHHDKAYKTN